MAEHPPRRAVSISGPSFALATRRTMLALFYVVAPVFLLTLVVQPTGRGYAYDFLIFRAAGRAYLHGHSPYPPAVVAVLAKQHSFVYPPPVAALFAPLALLPTHVGTVGFGALLVASVCGTLVLLGVRDPRVYAVALLWLPVLAGIRFGSISPLIALAAAAMWRFRDRRYTAALLLAATLVAKLFVWPLAIWLLLTRRWRTAAIGAGIALVVTVAAWAPIGIGEIRHYPHLLSVLSQAEQAESFSVVAFGLAAGLSAHSAHVVAALAAASLVALALAVRLRGRGDTDYTVFALMIGAALAASPIVWNHYFALLLVPVAIVAPRFGPIWVLPLVGTWLIPAQSHGRVALIAIAVVVPAATLAWAIAKRNGVEARRRADSDSRREGRATTASRLPDMPRPRKGNAVLSANLAQGRRRPC